MSRGCEATAEDYARQLVALLPQGPAWDGFRDPGGQGRQLFEAQAQEPARVHNRACDLLFEANPISTVEMLAARELEAGLPDDCTPDAATLQQRRDAVVAKWRGRGGQSGAFYIELGAALEYQIGVTEFIPFRAGQGEAGDPLTNDPWRHWWQVDGPAVTYTSIFQAGASTAGEPLRDWGDEILECVINRAKPAHTNVIFSYGE